MNSVTTTDRLRNLENEGLIDKKLRNTWQKIRNKAAHGYVLQPEKVGEYLKLSNQITVLFNHLVFLAISYTGNYTDYSEIGCPKKEYNKISN